jgi:hypothetical protein
MRRALAAGFALTALVALAARAAPVPKGSEGAEPNELPRGFPRDEIAKAAPPYGGEARTCRSSPSTTSSASARSPRTR